MSSNNVFFYLFKFLSYQRMVCLDPNCGNTYINCSKVCVVASGFRKRMFNNSLMTKQLILSTRASKIIINTMGTPACTFKQLWDNVFCVNLLMITTVNVSVSSEGHFTAMFRVLYYVGLIVSLYVTILGLLYYRNEHIFPLSLSAPCVFM